MNYLIYKSCSEVRENLVSKCVNLLFQALDVFKESDKLDFNVHEDIQKSKLISFVNGVNCLEKIRLLNLLIY